MNNFRHIVILLTICTAFISCEREDSRRYPVEESVRPIRFTTESVWPDITKAPITGLGDLLDDGFRVWGAWAKDPDDKSYFVGDYASGTNGSVFGSAGTAVNAVDENDDDVFDPNEGGDSWAYDNVRDWYRGYYSFAAVLPNSLFEDGTISSASLSSSFSKETSADNEENVTITYENTLTINFPEAGFKLLEDEYRDINGIDLSASLPYTHYKDLMFAFQTEDNSDDGSENVSLNFTHAFSLLGIKLLAENPDNMPYVTRVTLYGIRKSAEYLTFTHDTTVENYKTTESETTTVESVTVAGELSTEQDYFARFEMPEGHFENDATRDDMTLVRNLVVFPTSLQETPLLIKLEYKKVRVDENDTIIVVGEGEYTIEVNNGNWEPGNSYTLAFPVDDANFNEIQ